MQAHKLVLDALLFQVLSGGTVFVYHDCIEYTSSTVSEVFLSAKICFRLERAYTLAVANGGCHS